MEENVRLVVSWLGVLGIPSIFAMTMYCIRECRKFTKQLNILHSAQKAQMRSQLLAQYYVMKERGFAWADEVTEWENGYSSYHELVGVNGVLDARRAEVLHMPTKVR